MAGKKPQRHTPADMRLKRNRAKAAAKPKSPASPKTASSTAAAPGSKPKFGSPEWDLKYGIKRFKKGGGKTAAAKPGM